MEKPATGTYRITSLEQARLLSDPLRLKLIQAFALEPRTTKQIAGELGENVTKLYRHVDALHKVGLLELKYERPKRGTVERYYQAIAARFEVDAGLFATEGDSAAEASLNALFQGVRGQLGQALMLEIEDEDLEPFAARLNIKAGPEKIKQLRRLLIDWVEECSRDNEEESGEAISFSALLAFYPLPDTEAGDKNSTSANPSP